MNHIQKYKKNAVIISLDAEKAFYSVSWLHLFKVLEKFKISDLVINNVKALNDNPTFRIRINGYLTDSLTLERGVRQGCASSHLLFALYLEPLAQYIRQSKMITGIAMIKTEHTSACYTDDIILFITKPQVSADVLPKKSRSNISLQTKH